MGNLLGQAEAASFLSDGLEIARSRIGGVILQAGRACFKPGRVRRFRAGRPANSENQEASKNGIRRTCECRNSLISRYGASANKIEVPIEYSFTELSLQPAKQTVPRRLPLDRCYRIRQRYALRADLHAVLRVSAVRNASVIHDRFEPHILLQRSGGMLVKQPHLIKRRCADELRSGVYLRAGFKTAAASHARG